MRQEGVVYYIHTDHLGSTSVLSDGGGQPAGDRVAYLPYGGVRLGDARTLPTDYTFTLRQAQDRPASGMRRAWA
jgi:hypothetical protein